MGILLLPVIAIRALPSCLRAAEIRGADVVEGEEPQERWEDASSFAPVLNRPPLGARTPSSSSGYDTAETRWPGSTAGYTPTSAAGGLTPLVRDDGQPRRLPWERKESGYVIGSGELGLLNELQIPRRGAAVPLARGFLRLPSHSATSSGDSGVFEPPPSMEPLVPVVDEDLLTRPGDPLGAESVDQPDDRLTDLPGDRLSEKPGGSRSGSSSVLFSPMLPTTRGAVVWKRHSQVNTAGSTSDDRQSPSAVPSTGVTGGHPLSLEENPAVGSAGGSVQMQVRDGGEDNVWVDGSADDKMRKPRSGRGQVTRFPRGLSGEPSDASVGAGARGRPPPARSGSVWVGDSASPAHIVETASAAERITAFRPGTRFRVAVDKGLTGLGITIKEIRGRFFVYKLQTLADGSPGAAEVIEPATLSGTLLHTSSDALDRLVQCVWYDTILVWFCSVVFVQRFGCF